MSRLLLAILIILALTLSSVEPSESASAPRVNEAVKQKAQSGGGVRVIVQLATSAATQSPIDSDIIRQMRRGEVAQARKSVRANLLGTRHSVVREFEEVPAIALEVGVDGLQTLESLHGLVTEVVEDKRLRPALDESTAVVQANQVWAGGFGGIPRDGSGTVVAVLDSGVDKNHPFLAGKVVEEACYSSNVGGDTSFCPGGVTSSTAPGSGMPCTLSGVNCDHGTHVAGIVAGSAPGRSGVARGADIMAVQVFSRDADCDPDLCITAFTSDIMAGLERVYALRSVYNFAAVNLSLGGGSFSSSCDFHPMKQMIDQLRGAGIATVIASGNDGFADGISFPACISSAISVGSTGDGSGGAALDEVSSFSNSAPILSLLGPGATITSSVTPGRGFENKQGTSMATPHVAGAFAIMKEAGPTLTVGEMLNCLESEGEPVTDSRNGVTKPRIRILDALFCLPLGDVTAPAKVTDLKTASTTQSGVTLNWTAPGDDDRSGTARTYDLRFSTSRFTDAEWNTLTRVSGERAPMAAASPQSQNVENLLCGRTYFFAIKTFDESGNGSELSNVASARTGGCNRLTATRALPIGEAGVAYKGTFDIAGSPGPFAVDINEATLPVGVTFDNSQRTFTGTPQEAKRFRIAGIITDSVGSKLNARFNLRVAKPVEITTSTLRPGRANVAYRATPRAKNGVKAYAWTVKLNSALPLGSTFEFDTARGRIAVLSTQPGPVDITFQVTDALGGTDTQTLTLTFN
jgi:subtilisin family serine protease